MALAMTAKNVSTASNWSAVITLGGYLWARKRYNR